jgi:hypothetical protein
MLQDAVGAAIVHDVVDLLNSCAVFRTEVGEGTKPIQSAMLRCSNDESPSASPALSVHSIPVVTALLRRWPESESRGAAILRPHHTVGTCS